MNNLMNKLIKKFAVLFTAAAVISAVSGCGAASEKDSSKLQVYVSFYAMQSFAEEIGGDKVAVYTLCPTGTEPHDFEPTATDIAGLSDADVFIYNGLGMEPWIYSINDVTAGTDVITVEAAQAVPNISEDYDPHVWLDPENAYAQMYAIAEAFMQADSENSDYYAERLADCRAKIDKLTDDYKKAAKGFSQNTIITSHRAYFCLCNAFGLNQMAINGVDNSEDPSPAHMSEVESFIEANGIKYIFSEPLSSTAVVDAVASDTGCEVLILDPFEGSADGKDYFTVMYENLDALSRALK